MQPSAKIWARDPQYIEALQASQTGDWPRAEQAFTAILGRYGDDSEAHGEIEALLSEARLRQSLDQDYGKKVARARRPLPLRRIGVWLAIVALASVAVYAMVTADPPPVATPVPVNAEATTEAQRLALLEQARTAVASGRYADALAILQDLVSRFPLDEEAKQLLDWANQRWQLAVLYQSAGNLLAQSDWTGAIPVLEEIQSRDPSYRDVSTLLTRARQGEAADAQWRVADEAFVAGDWVVAAERFEAIRQGYPDYRKAEASDRLYQCYFSLGLATVNGSQGDPVPVEQAVELYTKALAQRPADDDATAERDLARMYLPAYEALDADHVDEAISYLQALYDLRFNYLNGVVAQSLYDAYMTRATGFEIAGDMGAAIADYAAAERLTGPNTTDAAQRRLALTMALTPTPTPTAPPTPTPFVWDSSLLPATPTPQPTPQSLATYRGQIAFWTDREGVTQIFLMNPDGSNQRPANLARWGATEFEELRKTESISPDRRWQVYVARGNNRIAQIWIAELDSGAISARNRQVTTMDDVCYDAVWSPDNYHVVFVSE
ncbi:MAG: tetratricopeptide repeat protein, partial [Anaerolineae bacterium]